jgi:UPF0755 protein
MKKGILSIIVILLLVGGYFGYKVFGPTVNAPVQKYFYVKTGSTYSQVKNELIKQKIISNETMFNRVAKFLKYPTVVKAGRYEIKQATSIYNLVKMLRSGNQAPVNLVINKLRTKEDLAAKIASNFEVDSATIISFLNNEDSLKKYDLDSNTLMTAVIPNTYSILWNTSFPKIFKKLHSEQQKFWNSQRKQKASALNMSPTQVYTMASIVEEETNKEEDKGKIASVYINRIETGMKLEADPTVKFAMKDFKLNRIMHKHLAYPSPYNTYQHTGLPPGPICTPSTKTIDAVLNAPQTNYIFFVAKPNFSGLSDFAATYPEHLVYAKKYQIWIDSLLKAKAAKAKEAIDKGQ